MKINKKRLLEALKFLEDLNNNGYISEDKTAEINYIRLLIEKDDNSSVLKEHKYNE